MDIESVAKVVFRYLKANDKPLYNYRSVKDWIKPLDEQYGRSFDYDTLLEAVTLLERRGLVMRNTVGSARDPDQFGKGTHLRDFAVYLTSIGKKSKIDEDVILLVDRPEEIVRALEQKVGNLDPVVRQYYLESLRAYQEGLYISSVICLGAASERAIHWLADTIESYCDKYQQPIQQRRGKMSKLIKYLSDSAIPIIFGADRSFMGELQDLLNELGDLYRRNRNDAGHPKTVEQTSWLSVGQAARTDLFRRYIATICEAIGRLK